LLHRLNQPVPQSVALLLGDAQRKEKKRKAKRVANRKSASTSRARKKALVEEMTKINARLKRQALILALLPDLVIAITTDGEITFCSDQVQNVLMYNIDDLMGAKLRSLVAPDSRDALGSLMKAIVKSENRQASREAHSAQGRAVTKRRRSSPRNSSDTNESKATGDNGKEANDSRRGSSRSAGGSGGDPSAAAAIVSEQSFPLSVVEVESKRSAIGSPALRNGHATTETNDNSDTSTSNGGKQQLSSLTNSASRSPTASSFGEDERGRGSCDSGGPGDSKTKKNPPSSDESSSLSSEAKNMRKANDNLDRNVRWHNRRMLEDTKKRKSDFGPKDDVTGASVTANNASARLSSLTHYPFISKSKDVKSPSYERNEDQSSSDDSLLAGVEEKKKTENVSDDSGYRESNDSREETSSSGSDTSNSNGKSTSASMLGNILILTNICLLCRQRAPKEEAGQHVQNLSHSTRPVNGLVRGYVINKNALIR
jgi:PAS domain-containing protein